jgi:hypothetical protein
MELYFLANNDLHTRPAEGEDAAAAVMPEEGKLCPLPLGVNLPSVPHDDIVRALGREITTSEEADRSIEDYALAVLELQRRQKHQAVEESAAEHIVGGLAQLTTVAKDGATSRIMQRWPDAIGERITPAPIDWSAWRAERVKAAVNSIAPDGMSKLKRQMLGKKIAKGKLRAV